MFHYVYFSETLSDYSPFIIGRQYKIRINERGVLSTAFIIKSDCYEAFRWNREEEG
jgi:hypothetical protein